jgi:hypothetical protein
LVSARLSEARYGHDSSSSDRNDCDGVLPERKLQRTGRERLNGQFNGWAAADDVCR